MKIKKQTGFTLIELLVVAGILVIITGIVMGTLLTSLRGNAKIEVTNNITQNANRAMTTINNDIKGSSNVISVGATPGCMTQPTAAFPTPTPLVDREIVLEQFDKSKIKFTCDNTTTPFTITKEVQPLTGSVKITKLLKDDITWTSCSFTCFQPDADEFASPIININFKLTQVGGVGVENIAEVEFGSSATLRNFHAF